MFARQPDWQYIVLVSQLEPDFSQFPHVRQIVVPFRRRLFERLWIQIIVIYFAFVKRVDVVHFARTIGGFAWPAKSVLTVFDVTTLYYPELHSRVAVWFWRHVQPLWMRQADQLIAISQNVANDLVRKFCLSPDKIEVVYCAPKAIFKTSLEHQYQYIESVRRKYDLPGRYLLFVGMLAKKKNLATLIHALHVLKKRYVDCPPLVIAGRRYRKSDDIAVLDQIRSLGLDSVVHYIGPVEDQELPSLYLGAEAFVFPSLHEGFGIPCLEAMVCRVPVVAARSGAIPEVVGDAALLVDDPLNAGALACAIQQVLCDASLRQRLIARGASRAEQFSWTRSADQVLALYRKVLGE